MHFQTNMQQHFEHRTYGVFYQTGCQVWCKNYPWCLKNSVQSLNWEKRRRKNFLRRRNKFFRRLAKIINFSLSFVQQRCASNIQKCQTLWNCSLSKMDSTQRVSWQNFWESWEKFLKDETTGNNQLPRFCLKCENRFWALQIAPLENGQSFKTLIWVINWRDISLTSHKNVSKNRLAKAR